ncbi:MULTISPECIES: PASTA domain-containing protein [unclassified Paenibacillus]|uniref:PASTA domain-containing protein n=1 Tax=unclassified Paenibacillus TaxID=185978 RepID=UPI001AE472EC|nr:MULTISPECIES: PASTA domain-containing protein [unclassified Paenibacillus]MBP1155686.1 serine/threonine-protein kinase [Paenibacillus sp. PvP091]MBP1168928.1 serine/threonine-protein kinase [Paenibacillus sp. PvR098]MBP2439956.1 serine/threonine-protein kinase [Paenibacillus sp. PvP052]
MEKRINQRYELLDPIVPMRSGILYSGNDLSLNRELLIFVVESQGKAHKKAYMRLLQDVAMFNDNRFLHILDVGIESHRIFAALKTFTGQPLIQFLKYHTYSPKEMITMVAELGKGLQDAMEHEIAGFTVLSSNVWVGEDGQLKIINYWEKGETSERGVQGLAGLLYQLLTRSEAQPDSLEAAEQSLRSALNEIPEGNLDMLMMSWRRAWNDQNTLSSFILSLQKVVQEPWAQAVQPMEELHLEEKEELDEPEESNEEEPPRRGFLWRASIKLLIGAGIASFSGLILIFLFGLGGPEERQPSAATDTHQRDISFQTPPSSTEPVPEPNIEQDEPTETPADTQPSSNEPVDTPSLVGLSKEEAEKQALASGLRYKFFLEPHESPANTVFRQDLEAGQKVAKGESITFWISKGN